ncbi:hypothetical protein Lser_V15G25429 [Lactuca serriola]
MNHLRCLLSFLMYICCVDPNAIPKQNILLQRLSHPFKEKRSR